VLPTRLQRYWPLRADTARVSQCAFAHQLDAHSATLTRERCLGHRAFLPPPDPAKTQASGMQSEQHCCNVIRRAHPVRRQSIFQSISTHLQVIPIAAARTPHTRLHVGAEHADSGIILAHAKCNSSMAQEVAIWHSNWVRVRSDAPWTESISIPFESK